MVLLIVVSTLIVFIFSKLLYGGYLNAATITTLIWTVGVLITQTNSYRYLRVEDSTLFFVLIFIFVFNLSYLMFHRKVAYNYNNFFDRKDFNRVTNVLFLVAFFGLLLPLVNASKIIAEYGFSLKAVRDYNYLFIDNSFSSVGIFFVRTIPSSILKISLLFFATRTYSKKSHYILTIILLIVTVIVYGGRLDILLFLIFFIIDVVYQKKYSKFKVKKRYLFFALVVLVIITNLRSSSSTNLFRTIESYLGAPFSYFQYLYNNMYNNLQKTMGYLSFSFIIEPFALFAKIFKNKIKIPSHVFNLVAQPFADIGSSSRLLYNNNSTSLFIWLWDFGKLGIVFGAILFTLTLIVTEKYYLKSKNVYRYNFLIFIHTYALFSSIEYPYLSMIVFLVFGILMAYERITIR